MLFVGSRTGLFHWRAAWLRCRGLTIRNDWRCPRSIERLFIGRLKLRQPLAQLFRQIVIFYRALLIPLRHLCVMSATHNRTINQPGIEFICLDLQLDELTFA
jgi:hypothetical protein